MEEDEKERKRQIIIVSQKHSPISILEAFGEWVLRVYHHPFIIDFTERNELVERVCSLYHFPFISISPLLHSGSRELREKSRAIERKECGKERNGMSLG